MKKFDFSKEFGNIDSKYIREAEGEWKKEKEIWTPRFWSRVAAACVIVTLGSAIFSNPHVQAAIKNLTLSIGETLGFSKGIESYTEVLDTSKTDNGITATLKEVVVDDGLLLVKIHAEKAELEEQKEMDAASKISFTNMDFGIDYQNSTINGQKIEEYGSGTYLPYSMNELMENGRNENAYDEVLESRFQNSVELGESPKIHLVLCAYNEEDFGRNPVATFQFDFQVSHAELMKQTIHKKLENISIETREGTVKLTDFFMNKLQSSITAEIPDELYGKYDLELLGTDSKGNLLRYELNAGTESEAHQWIFKTDFWGMYWNDSDEPTLLIPDMDSEYMELQLYIREPYTATTDSVWDGDAYVEVGETTAEVEEVQEDYKDDGNISDTDENLENQIIGGATGSTAVMIKDDIDENENADVAEEDEFYGTEESTYNVKDSSEKVGEEAALADDGWIPVGNRIKIQIK